jgi:hypothetical protein
LLPVETVKAEAVSAATDKARLLELERERWHRKC